MRIERQSPAKVPATCPPPEKPAVAPPQAQEAVSERAGRDQPPGPRKKDPTPAAATCIWGAPGSLAEANAARARRSRYTSIWRDGVELWAGINSCVTSHVFCVFGAVTSQRLPPERART